MQQQSDRTVYVGNVGKEVDEAALMALFGHCGTVRCPCAAAARAAGHGTP
jgi:RNA recognition motif-containing protein